MIWYQHARWRLWTIRFCDRLATKQLLADDLLAFLSYAYEDNAVVMDHTYVPAEFRGRGVATTLVRAALDEARRRNWRIVPRCSFVAASSGGTRSMLTLWIARSDMVADQPYPLGSQGKP